MVKIRTGGDPESYMEAPSLGQDGYSDSDGGFIAGLLDLLGIHRQVAKGPKGSKDSKKPGVTAPIMADDAPIQTAMPILDIVTQAVGTPNAEPTTPFGQRWLDSIQPIITFDPGASTASRKK